MNKLEIIIMVCLAYPLVRDSMNRMLFRQHYRRKTPTIH